MTRLGTRIAVTVVFAAIYLAFLIETAALYREFGTGVLGFQISNLYAQNFIFFPIAGLLAVVAFWRPAVLIVDALAGGAVRFGRLLLVTLIVAIGAAGWMFGQMFDDENARSIFEVAPAALVADEAAVSVNGTVLRAPIPETLIRLRINAAGDGGLTRYAARCDREWVQFSVAADEKKLCFPTGREISVADCCQARERFQSHLNQLQSQNPSQLAQIHRMVLPVKSAFLIMLLVIGLLLVQFRKPLQARYGTAVDDVSFGVASGGVVMLLWPLMNAAHLETIALLTGDGTSNAYTIMAPLIALGFAVFAVLLAFFHLRTYPEQIEYFAKLGGAAVAALGVFRYEEIVGYLSQTLGIGGGPVAVAVFIVAVASIIAAVVMGVTSATFDGEEDEAEAEANTSRPKPKEG